MSRKAGTAGAGRGADDRQDEIMDAVAAGLRAAREAPAAGAGQETAAGPAAPDAAAPAPAPADTPAPPGPGRWRWNAAAGRHEKITGEN